MAKKIKTVVPPARTGVGKYLDDSKNIYNSLILIIPLFILYQVGVMMTGGVRNGVDFMTDVMWSVAGATQLNYLLLNLGILLIFAAFLFLRRKQTTFNLKLWPLVLAESTVYAFFFGAAVIGAMSALGLDVLLSTGDGSQIATMGIFTKFVLSIGAGLYEELVFRLFLMGGMFWAGVRLLNFPRWLSALAALILSSVIFSAIHHVGSMGEPFVLGTFMFRVFAGMLLAAIFHLRGFAVAVYTHAIYDIIVLIFR